MKYISFPFILLLLTINSSSCEICGSGNGIYFPAPYFHYQKNHFGLRYTQRNYFSRMANEPSEFSKDRYQTIEAVSTYQLGKGWQLMTFIPYAIKKMVGAEHTARKSGIGDFSALLHYQILNKPDHKLLTGLGLKIPSGTFSPEFDGHPVPAANLQSGTGSMDCFLNMLQVIRLKTWSFYNNCTYTMSGKALTFKFGDRITGGAAVSRRIRLKTPIHTFAGIQLEWQARSEFQGQKIESSGGHVITAVLGDEFELGVFNIGFTLQKPLSQHISEGQTKSRTGFILNLGMLL